MALITRIASFAATRALAGTLGAAAGGPMGAAAGLLLPAVARRLGPWGVIGVAVGSYAVRRLARAAETRAAAKAATPAARQPIVTPPPIAWSPAADAF
jgi:hypothetical protein